MHNRLKKGKQLRKAADITEVKNNIHLLRSPAGKCYHSSSITSMRGSILCFCCSWIKTTNGREDGRSYRRGRYRHDRRIIQPVFVSVSLLNENNNLKIYDYTNMNVFTINIPSHVNL